MSKMYAPEHRPLKAPILLVVSSKPDVIRVALEAIRKAQPERLYVAISREELHYGSEAEHIVDSIDWECKVKTQLLQEGLKPVRGVPAAITWFFDHESEGIILRDDCLPVPEFFVYCKELLERFRDDVRVMHIDGSNPIKSRKQSEEYAYHFTRYGDTLGWATWRRAWNLYDHNIAHYNEIMERDFFCDFFTSPFERRLWIRTFDLIASGKGADVVPWTYRWDFCRFINSGLTIVPENNLLEGSDVKEAYLDGAETKLTWPLSHPPFVIRNIEYDSRYYHYALKKRFGAK